MADQAEKLRQIAIEKKLLKTTPQQKLQNAKGWLETLQEMATRRHGEIIDTIHEAYGLIIAEMQNENDKLTDEIEKLKERK